MHQNVLSICCPCMCSTIYFATTLTLSGTDTSRIAVIAITLQTFFRSEVDIQNKLLTNLVHRLASQDIFSSHSNSWRERQTDRQTNRQAERPENRSFIMSKQLLSHSVCTHTHTRVRTQTHKHTHNKPSGIHQPAF